MPKKSEKVEAEKDKEEESKKVVVVEEVEDSPVEDTVEKVKDDQKEPAEKDTKDTGEADSEDKGKVVSEKEEINVDQDKPSIGKLLWIIVPTTLLVGALAGGIITYFSGLSVSQPEPSPVPSESSMPEEEKTTDEDNIKVSDLKREDLKIQVLNGSGVAGAAGKARDFMEGLGYSDVAVGNADASDYKETEISISDEKKDYLDLLKKDLAEKYSLASESSSLPSSSGFDVVITLGSK